MVAGMNEEPGDAWQGGILSCRACWDAPSASAHNCSDCCGCVKMDQSRTLLNVEHLPRELRGGVAAQQVQADGLCHAEDNQMLKV